MNSGELNLGPNEHIPEKIIETMFSKESNVNTIPEVKMVTNCPQMIDIRIVCEEAYDKSV